MPGKISFVAPQKHNFLPGLQEKLDAAFITSKYVDEETQKVKVEEDKSKETEGNTVSFPSTLSNF